MDNAPTPTPLFATPAKAPSFVVKRSGQTVPFDAEKITQAIAKAGAVTGEFDAEDATQLSATVCKVLAYQHPNEPPTIEKIQDMVEQTLVAADRFLTACAYIVYREQRSRMRQDRKSLVDAVASMNEYLSQSDWRVCVPTPTRAIRWVD